MRSAAESLDLLTDLVAQARRAGADAADALYVDGVSLSHAQRLGKTERLERAEGRDLGLRVFIGKKQAIASSSDQSQAALRALVERVIAMARVVPDDPYCGLADEGALERNAPALDIDEAAEPTPETLIARAKDAEDAALAVKGVTNSEGAEAGWGRTRVALVTSQGFHESYTSARHSVGVAVIAGDGLGMERDYAHASAIHASDLESPRTVGTRAGERATRRLGARKMPSAKVSVVYDPRIAGGLLRHLAGAISGAAIARGTSFLKDKLGQAIFPSGITVIDDPHRPRGLASKPFDGEGVRNARRAIIERGALTTWLLDSRSARQLGLATTGHAARGTSAPPSPAPTNLYFEPGPVSPAALMADITSGLYVTELIGMGVNLITGDYSRGAAGFWIENGAIAYPVHEVTIAGHLGEMFRHLSVADDLAFRYGIDSPTVRIDGMTVAGT
ncbi:MAG: metallopeptidase TldD-related protein [Alphaproteobacteria bacterium]